MLVAGRANPPQSHWPISLPLIPSRPPHLTGNTKFKSVDPTFRMCLSPWSPCRRKCMASFAFKCYAHPMPLWPGQSTPRPNFPHGPTLEDIARANDAPHLVRLKSMLGFDLVEGRGPVQPRVRLRVGPANHHSRHMGHRNILVAHA